MTLPLQWRDLRPDERVYVLSSWIKSYASNSEDSADYHRRGVPDFGGDYAPVVRNLVARSRIIVACPVDDPSLMVGWMAIEGADTLHYLVTKPRYRRTGVAKWMVTELDGLPVIYTHETRKAAQLVGPKWTYRRWRIWPAEEKTS